MKRSGSEENVELVRKAWDAFPAGDVEAALASAHRDAVAFRAPPLPDPQTYHGPQGVLEMLADWRAPFADFEISSGQTTSETSVGAGSSGVAEGQHAGSIR